MKGIVMENNENNNLNELEQLKAQYETLKQQFDQQEIVNSKLMETIIKNNISSGFNTKITTIVLSISYVMGFIVLDKWFASNVSIFLYWIFFIPVFYLFYFVIIRKFSKKSLENSDLHTILLNLKSFKKTYKLFNLLGYSTVLIIGFFYVAYVVGVNFNDPVTRRGCLMLFWGMFISFAVAMLVDNYVITRKCNKIIKQIEKNSDVATNFQNDDMYKKQRLFRIVMILVFIALDVWAFMIAASSLRLPPIYRTLKYERPAKDLTTEGKLEIWEVYADTLVNQNDVTAVKNYWQQNDSLVLMTERAPIITIEMDKDSEHAWKENNDEKVRLYALKKTTSEGPAISSALIGSKPAVKIVTFNYGPDKKIMLENTPIVVFLTPEASNLWYEFTKKESAKQKRGALCLDGVVYQDWLIKTALSNGSFFIMRKWSNKEELEEFCKQLIRN